MNSTAYNDAIFDKLVHDFKVTEDQRKTFHQGLIIAERTWREISDYPTTVTQDKEIKRELEALHQAADAFQAALSSLSPATWLTMEKTSQALVDSKYDPKIGYIESPSGIPAVTVFDDSDPSEHPPQA